MQKITPFLWFNGNAEAAVKFYLSVFRGSKILQVIRTTAAGPGPIGSVLTIKFRLLGQDFVALNGGPDYTFNRAISFFVNCRSQKEVDYYWRRLSAGGERIQCGWLEDRYGIAWQIVPTMLLGLIGDKDPKKAARVMTAMMGMVKLEIKGLRQAAKKPRA